MSTASIIRRAVKTARRSVRGVEVEVTHEHGITRTAYGARAFAHTDTVKAIVEPVTQAFRDTDGSSRVSKATVTFLGSVKVGSSDRITLPSGQTGPILRISEGLADPSNADGGGYFTEVILG